MLNSSNSVKITCLALKNNIKTYNKDKIAEEFNNYFAGIGIENVSKLDIINNLTHKNFLKQKVDSRFEFKPVNEQEIQQK